MSLKSWLPLESNPDVVNKYVHGIGLPNSWRFVDVYGLDPDLLAIIPQPVIALLLLFPWTKNTKEISLGTVTSDKTVYFIRQSDTIGNACGTIALLHALANNSELLGIEPTSVVGRFFQKSKDMLPEERATLLENCHEISLAHEGSALEGQTEAPARDEEVDCHFVALVHKDNNLYEMDGTKSGPVLHGRSTKKSFLSDAASVVKKFMERDPEELNFTVMALVDATDD